MDAMAAMPAGTPLLLVDDQPDIRRLVRMTLEGLPYVLHEAADGASGLALAEQVRPALVLLDVMMPGSLDGLQVCQRLRAHPVLAATRVLLLTARHLPGAAGPASAGSPPGLAGRPPAGADAVLAKPFSPLQLIETIERLLEPAAGA